MPSTTNFSWTTPSDSDLVKDGALAIRTLGNGIDTSLVDLKGGTTGQALTKATNTDLDYSWTNIIPASTYNAAGKNATINGGCEIAQRGTSAVTLTAASFLYPVDRFLVGRSSGTSGATAQQISSTGLDGFQYAVRIQRTAGNTATNDLYIGQSFETANSIPFANKTIVFSFWARAGANYSPTSSALNVRFYTGTGTDQAGLGSAFTGSATPISQTATLTTSWQRFQYSATLASTATQMQFLLFATPTGTAGAADSFDVTGFQVELGSVATAFSRSAGTLTGELAACQRYYYRANYADGDMITGGQAFSATGVYGSPFPFPVTMRTKPSVAASGATHFKVLNSTAGAFLTSSALTLDRSSYAFNFNTMTVASGLTAGNSVIIFSNNSGCFTEASAEL